MSCTTVAGFRQNFKYRAGTCDGNVRDEFLGVGYFW